MGLRAVVPEAYHRYKAYGAGNIPIIAISLDRPLISESDQELINGIVDECVQYSASALVDITVDKPHGKNLIKQALTAPLLMKVLNISLKRIN